jgi:hypothetical protein
MTYRKNHVCSFPLGKILDVTGPLMKNLVAIALLFTGLAGCSQPTNETKVDDPSIDTGQSEPAAPAVDQTMAVSTCPDDGPRLPLTNICAGRAHNYMNWADQEAPHLPDDCDWATNETALPGGEILIYQALRCNGVTAKLEFAGGAHFAELLMVRSALSGEEMDGHKIATIAAIHDGDPVDRILQIAKDNAAEQGIDPTNCMVHSTDDPFGYLVVDISKAEREALSTAPDDMGPAFECGSFGAGDVTSMWRIFGGQLWFFDFGQDMYEFDPRSFTVLAKDQDSWAQVE